MKKSLVLIALFAAVMVACQIPEPALDERVVNIDSEILYNDVIREQVPSDQITFFGINFGDSHSSVLELHGEPLYERQYTFGRIVNSEYDFTGNNESDVLFHFELGELTSVLITQDASELFMYESLLGQNSTEMVNALGTWTVSESIAPYRVRFYDPLGYEFYQRRGVIQQIYFTTPNRGLSGPGVDVNASYPTSQ